MAESPPPSMSQKNPSSSSSSPPRTTMTDLDADALAHCATYLSLNDVSNMAMTCKYLHNVAYSDSIWNHLFRLRWPNQTPSCERVREAYLSQRTKTLQFRFSDPFVVDYYTDAKPVDHVLLNQNAVIISKGPVITIENIDEGQCERGGAVRLTDHNARITCMRTFPLCETSLYRSETQTEENFLVTSSSDHSIRLWWKGSCRRCLRGHSGPVTALSDKLVGNGTGKLLASGGEDGTVRLWSLSGGRGQRALKATFYGHEKPIKLISVAGHKTSLLVTISGDSKVRLWDANAPSAARSSCCVGMTSVPGPLVNMKCHEQLLYVAAGSSVAAIDMRTMRKVLTCAVDKKLYSFEAIPSNSLFCVGGSNGRAMLYDVRRIKVPPLKSEAVAELDGGHTGPLTHLHMDQYKIVTGGRGLSNSRVHVWESNTGASISSWCCFEDAASLDAMAVNGSRIVTASTVQDLGLITLKDFRNASCALVNNEDDRLASDVKSIPTGGEFPCFPKFWNQQSDSDNETE